MMDKFKPKCVRYRGEFQSPFADCSSFPTVDFSKFDFPIKIIEAPMDIRIEKEVFSAAKRVGVIVEKDELLRALNHERDQFAAGYAAGFEAAQPKWISVEERLPGDPLDGVGDVVELLIDKGDAKEVLPGYYDHDKKDWVIYFGDISGDYRRKVFPWWRVIKWRPFPEPPKEEA